MKIDSGVLNNVSARENVFLKRVYLWMALGLAVTAGFAFSIASSENLMRSIMRNPSIIIVAAVVELVLVVFLSARLERMKSSTAMGCFLGYSAVNGITMSSIFYAYAGTTIIPVAFGISALFFGIAGIYGAVTKRNIRGWGGWLMYGLFALIIVSMIGLFVGGDMLDLAIIGFGLILFAGLTAWDTNKIVQMNRMYGASMSEDELTKISIIGALELYLDFINIFLYIVRLLARNKD